jgi:hypothetical protein
LGYQRINRPDLKPGASARIAKLGGVNVVQTIWHEEP